MRRYKLLFLIAALLLLVGAAFLAWPAYKNWQQARLLAQAKTLVAQSDFAKASLCLRKVLRRDPSHVEACRSMAQLAELVRSPQAVAWRQRVVELEPAPLVNRLDLAYTALQMRQFAAASTALGNIDASGQRSPAFHQAAAALALATNHLNLAEKHLAHALTLNPTNQTLRLNLTVLRLAATNAQTAAEARAALHQMRSVPELKLTALRTLIADERQRKQLETALELSAELEREPGSSFDDALTRLALLTETKHPEAPAYLAALQKRAATNPGSIFALSTWMLSQKRTDEALAWIKSLPPSMQAQPPVPLALADCYLASRNWAEIPAQLDKQNWGGLDFLRGAVILRAYRELNRTNAPPMSWPQIVKAAAGRLESLSSLVQLTTGWDWHPETEELLWLIADRYPEQRWALQSLHKYYAANNHTRGLQRTFARLVELDPANMVAKNNLATTSFLVVTQVARAYQLAREVYAKEPANPAFASTYAYALHLQGQTADGLAILRRLKPSDLESPSIAAYHASLLAATGDVTGAQRYASLAEKGRLLPEEEALARAAALGR